MSEEILVRHCSPTLANIKTGNLVNCRIDSIFKLKKDIISLNSVLNAKGVSIRILYFSSERALIYVYPQSQWSIQKCIDIVGLVDLLVLVVAHFPGHYTYHL